MLIAIQETPIHQNKDGLYSLNDIHRIAGGDAKDQPSNWLRLDKTKELIEAYSEELQSTINTKAGRYGGTYVCKDLAYDYAAWIDRTVYVKLLQSIEDLEIIKNALNNFEVPDDIPDMYVYAIKNTSTGNIKLGISKNPEQRLKQLQTGCDGKLELVAYRKAVNGFKDEQLLHIENKQYNIHGEWFVEQSMDGWDKK